MGAIAFRRLADTDLPALVGWMAAAHAQPWFGDEPRTPELAQVHYAAELDGSSATRMWIVTCDGIDIGYIQDYPVIAYDDYAVRVCRDYPDAPRFVASPDVRNARSIRVLEKCGFTQGLWIQPEAVTHPEVVCTAPREHFEDA